jgi:hypothetical protein
MFFKKKKINHLTKWGPLSETAWDDETVKRIAQSEHLNVKITHITKTISLGDRGNNMLPPEDRTDWEVHGVMTYPKFIPVTITFTKDEKQFGGFFYNRSDNNTFNEQKIILPRLEVWLSDDGEQRAVLLSTALRDAILSGRKYAGVRFFKKKDEGLMTQIDKEYGWSYESRYMILGLVTWQELHAGSLPKWTLPTDYNDFSLDDLPESSSDLDRQLVR